MFEQGKPFAASELEAFTAERIAGLLSFRGASAASEPGIQSHKRCDVLPWIPGSALRAAPE